ncbi:peptidylprolyl isomerase [Candidatus Woesearchaeota archaeon]|nr:peptidylprolyl isomerase [Candidatus Woesearchaeota archaeon]
MPEEKVSEEKKETETQETAEKHHTEPVNEMHQEQLLKINVKPKKDDSETQTHHESKEQSEHNAQKHLHHHPQHHQQKKQFYKNKFFYAAVILVLLIVGILTSYLFIQTNKNTLVTVNNEKITAENLADEINLLPPQYQQTIGKEQLEKTIVEQLIVKRLLLQEAAKKQIIVTDDELNKAIDDFIASVGLTKEEFTKKLQEQAGSIDAVKEIYRQQLIINKLLSQEVYNKIIQDDKQLENYYNENKEDIIQLRASHILLCYNSSMFCANNRTEEQAKQLGVDLLKKLAAGEQFEQIAKQYSDDPSANNGGDLGWFGKGDMVLPFEEASLKLNKGEVSPLVKTQFGYHIIRLTAKNESFSDLKSFIATATSAEKKQTAVKEYIDALKKSAVILYAKK